MLTRHILYVTAKIVYSNEEINKIVSLYLDDKLSHRDIGKIFNVSKTVISRVLHENNVVCRNTSETMRIYELNEHFFDNIDTEEKAYFFGLLYADGCNFISSINRRTCHLIRISLQERDAHILKELSKLIFTNREVKYNIKKADNSKHCFVSISSRHMSDTLNNYGMTPRKSLTKVFPQVILDSDPEIQRHFIRGYFDGNGYVIIHKPRKAHYTYQKYSFGITSTLNMCETIKCVIENNTNVRSLTIIQGSIRENSKDIIKVIKTSNKHDVIELLDWLYKNSTYYLYRKHDKYLEMKSSYLL